MKATHQQKSIRYSTSARPGRLSCHCCASGSILPARRGAGAGAGGVERTAVQYSTVLYMGRGLATTPGSRAESLTLTLTAPAFACSAACCGAVRCGAAAPFDNSARSAERTREHSRAEVPPSSGDRSNGPTKETGAGPRTQPSAADGLRSRGRPALNARPPCSRHGARPRWTSPRRPCTARLTARQACCRW